MTYKVSSKVINALYDLKWAIEHNFIKLDVMFNDELEETDMEDLAIFLEDIFWELHDPDEKIEFVEFNIEREEE